MTMLLRLRVRLVCVLGQSLLLSTVLLGCSGSAPSMRVWGEVRYEGQPIDDGQIIFSPLEGTAGPSTGGPITGSRYDIAQSVGPYAGGKYRVLLTASGATRTYNPNASGQGDTVTVREQLLPAAYNQSSTLSVEVSRQADQNCFDLLLP